MNRTSIETAQRDAAFKEFGAIKIRMQLFVMPEVETGQKE
jgi:hypothetical protein